MKHGNKDYVECEFLTVMIMKSTIA
jgi:hypothetical protein